jgi:hypothetical protein
MSDGKNFLKQIAPTLAAFLFGPAGGVVAEIAGKALGMDGADIGQIRDAVRKNELTGDQIAALRSAEIQAQAKEKELGIRADEIAANDRDSARKMQMTQPSRMPAILTILTTCGFFGVLGAMFYHPDIKDSGPMMIMLGQLSAGWAAALAFWFGTTSGSKTKTDLLAQSSPVK